MMECKCDICGTWVQNSEVTLGDFKQNNWIFCMPHREEFLNRAFKIIYAMKEER